MQAARVADFTEAALDEAYALIAKGEVVAFPTETFYGLAADPFNPAAVARVFAIKRRPPDSPVALILAEPDLLARVSGAPLSRDAAALASRFWPGPLTLVVRAHPALPAALTAGTGTVGVRVSPHAGASAVSYGAGAITATSANRSGSPALRTAREVAEALPELPLVLDGGTTEGGFPSTVVDVTGAVPRLVREGAVPLDALRAIVPSLTVT